MTITLTVVATPSKAKNTAIDCATPTHVNDRMPPDAVETATLSASRATIMFGLAVMSRPATPAPIRSSAERTKSIGTAATTAVMILSGRLSNLRPR